MVATSLYADSVVRDELQPTDTKPDDIGSSKEVVKQRPESSRLSRSSTASDDELQMHGVDVRLHEDTLLQDSTYKHIDDIPVMQKVDSLEAVDAAPQDWSRGVDTFPISTTTRDPLRRSTTISVVPRNQSKSIATRMLNEPKHEADACPPVTLTRSRSAPERAAAMEAISSRSTLFQYAMSSRSVRASVRQMYSYLFNDFPHVCNQSTDAKVKLGPIWREMEIHLGREGLSMLRTSLVRKTKKEICVQNDDILGAIRTGTTAMTLHFMKQGKGKNEEKLKRRYRQMELKFASANEVDKWVNVIQILVKWDARVPMEKTRKIKVVVNPHSGKRRGLQIWQKWKPVFELAGIQCDMETTQYSGHARDIGKSLDLSAKYEAIVFVGGDGTVNEFMNGVFARDEDDWRHLVATTPVSLLCAGTDNAFGLGVGIPTHEAAVYCIIKRKIRPLDVLTCETADADGAKRREFACCGVSYGIGADIAVESESTRWLGVYRYMWLKIKRGVFAPRPHECTIKYVLSDTVEKDPVTGDQLLQTYYEISDKNAQDQHHIEMCSVYDDACMEKRWNGDAEGIYNPASEERFADQWKSESGDYTTVGASNVYFETEFYHPSDGNMDLIIARRGPLGKTIDVGMKYIAGNYLESSLVDYFKIKALVIEQKGPDPINVDGEVFPGPGPFRVEVVPRLLNVLSEK